MNNEERREIYLTPGDVAERWGMSRRTLDQWRYEGRGPAYVKLGGIVRYRLRAVEAYERAMEHAGGEG